MFRVLKKYCVTTPILTPSIFCMDNNENNVKLSENNVKFSENNVKLCNISKIRSNCVLSKVFKNLQEKIKLEMCRYNNVIKRKLNVDKEDYPDFNSTIFDITVKNDSDKKKEVSLFNIIKQKKIGNNLITKEEGYGNYFNLYLYNGNIHEKIKFISKPKSYKIRKADINCHINYSVYSGYACTYPICSGESKFQLKIDKKVRDLTALFVNCNQIKEITVEKSCKDLYNLCCMFYGCKNVENLYLDKLKTANVSVFSDMFCKCEKIKYLDVSSFDTGKATTFRRMFGSCFSLEILSLNNLSINDYRLNFSLILSYCNSLKYIIIDDDDMRKSFKEKIIDRKTNSTYGLITNEIELIKSIDDVKKERIKLINDIDSLLNKNKN